MIPPDASSAVIVRVGFVDDDFRGLGRRSSRSIFGTTIALSGAPEILAAD
jgi:hypothetical protein